MRLTGSRGRYEPCDGWRACLSAMAARLKQWADARWREERYDYPDAPLVGAPGACGCCLWSGRSRRSETCAAFKHIWRPRRNGGTDSS